MPIIIRVSKHRSKPQPKPQASAPRSVKIVKPKASQEEKSSEPVQVVRQIRRPRNAAAALLAWNNLFGMGVVQ